MCAARLVRLGLQRELVAVLLRDRVFAEIIDGLAQPFDGVIRPTAPVGLRSLATAPHHEDLRAELRAQIHRAHRLLQRIGAHARIVRRECAVAEHRIVEQIHRRHRHHDAVLLESGAEVAYDLVAFGCRRIDRHQVVVVEVHAPCANLREQRNQLDGRFRRTHGIAERIASAIPYGP